MANSRISAAERQAIIEEAERKTARKAESTEQGWVRQAIREEVADALRGFFVDEDGDAGDDDGRKAGGPGTILDGLFGRRAAGS